MNPKTLQYLMGHSAKDEMIRLEELEAAKKEVEKVTGEKPITSVAMCYRGCFYVEKTRVLCYDK